MSTQVSHAYAGLQSCGQIWRSDLTMGDASISRLGLRPYCLQADYVPLLRRAYELWHELEAESGQVAGPAHIQQQEENPHIKKWGS